MGLFSWFFPGPEDRVRTARKKMESRRWADARLEVLDLDHPEAMELQKACETELARMNLHEALSWAQAGDDARVMHHMELADTFHHGGLEDAFRDTRRELREIRRERDEAEQRRREAEEARALNADPFGVAGGPSWLDRTVPADFFDGHFESKMLQVSREDRSYYQSLLSMADIDRPLKLRPLAKYSQSPWRSKVGLESSNMSVVT